MRLFFSPGACSLSPHIALREAGIPFEAVQVHLGSKRTQAGDDFRRLNPKGSVPALEISDGVLLTEGPAIVQYIADLKPASQLAPPCGTMPRYRLQEWLNYISTELHKQFSPLFNGSARAPESWRQVVREGLFSRLDYVSDQLAERTYLMGEAFTVADCYLFTVLRWTRPVKIDLGRWPTLHGYAARVTRRPAVQAALAAEGLTS